MIPKGFRFAGVRCGLKNKRNDIGLLVSDFPVISAGVVTQNQVRAACVGFTQEALRTGSLQALVVNSGNANCCTGEQGARDTQQMATLAATALGLSPTHIGVASTGVIGQLLDMSRVEKGISEAGTKLDVDPKPFMEAILTTDLVEKWASVDSQTRIVKSPQNPHGESGMGRVYGVAKGSGMIAPNMATMLGFVVSDLDVSQFDLQAMVKRVSDRTFSCMLVDGDTSTNDMLLVLANGASGIVTSEADFEDLLESVCLSLSKQIARDGEGATKLVEIHVTGTDDPTRIARTIAESPLVKTAMFGCDPNWGRILMAAGRAGVEFDPSGIKLILHAAGEDHVLFENNGPAPFDVKRVSTALKSDHVVIDLTIGPGNSATVYTCDFGYGYVRINAEYHT